MLPVTETAPLAGSSRSGQRMAAPKHTLSVTLNSNTFFGGEGALTDTSRFLIAPFSVSLTDSGLHSSEVESLVAGVVGSRSGA